MSSTPAGDGARQTGTARRFDILIRNGRVLDGTGNPWYPRRHRHPRRPRSRGRTASGRARRRRRWSTHTDRYVTPGFIDVHSHAGPGLLTAGLKHGQPVLAQGITTVLVNPDGGGPVDLAAQRATYEKQGIGPNVGLFVPHGSIRQQVMGMSDRDPDAADLAKMVALAREGMQAGGVGLSSGLYYAPGSYSKTAEVVAMARATAPFGGVYSQPHPRRGRLHHRCRRGRGRSDHDRRAGRGGRRRLAHEGAGAGQLGPVEDAGRAHREPRAPEACRSSPTSMPTKPAARASSAR